MTPADEARFIQLWQEVFTQDAMAQRLGFQHPQQMEGRHGVR
jgi:hypothetical protein